MTELVCRSLGRLSVVAVLLFGRKKHRRAGFLVAAVTAALIYGPDLIEATREMIANLLVFHMDRPPDTTSLMYFLPAWSRLPLSLASWAGMAAIALGPLGPSGDAGRQATRLSAIQVLFFWGAGAVHGNYLLWFYPFVETALARNLWRVEPRAHP